MSVDFKTLDRVAAKPMNRFVYPVVMAAFSVAAVAFFAMCFSIASGWDAGSWSVFRTVVALALALGLMGWGMRKYDGFEDSVMSGLGFAASAAGAAALFAGVMYWLPVSVDMMRVFVLCALLAVVMCGVCMVMRMCKMDNEWFSLGVGLVLVVVGGLACEWLFGLGWLNTMLGWFELSTTGGLTKFDWFAWLVFGLLVVVSMTRGMKGTTGREAVDGGASVFCCRL